jgi:toluene monooxygenase electron transfer component
MPTVTVTATAAQQACTFECGDGERVLHAGLRAGAALPYECASGTCGKCRATLLDGKVHDLWPQAPGRAALKSPNELLMCQSTATGDVKLAVIRMQGAALVKPANRNAVVSVRRELTPEIVEITLSLDEPLSFRAGQFVLLDVPGVAGPRAYSMVNYDAPADALRFIIRRKAGGGFTDWAFADCAGSDVRVFGPLGKAVFDPASQEDIVCIAGGSGIAGMLSIASSALAHGHLDAHRLDLFFGVRTSRALFYADELTRLSEAGGPRFSATVAFSEDGADDGLAGRYPFLNFESGFVHEVALRARRDQLKNSTAFLAGPPVAVDAGIRSLLTIARMPLNRIRFDKYS